MTDAKLQAGIVLAKAGKKSDAREILSQVVKSDPRSVLGWLWLAGVVETEEQQRYCLERVLQLNPQNQVVRRVLTQLKLAPPQVAAGSQYFIGHHLASGSDQSVRGAIANVFDSQGFAPCCVDEATDETSEEQSPLFRTCQKIFLSSFGIVDLSSGDPNSYIELGIALGLNRPFIAIAQEGTALLAGLEGQHVITYNTPEDLRAKLLSLRDKGFPPAARPVPDYCHFCGQVCESMATPPDENAYLVLNESKMLWRSLMRSLTPHLAKYNLHPVYLSDRASGSLLCNARSKVLASQFALCHLGALSGNSGFLILGMAIGSRVPWVLLSMKDQDPVPLLLEGFDGIEYSSLADLEGRLTETLATFLSKVMPASVPRPDRTTVLSLPFWVQLDDWISRVKHATQAPEAIQGRIRVIQYEGKKHLLELIVSNKGLLFGRDPDCDVVVEAPSVSAHHFRILQGRGGKCYIQDMYSKNGTFLNGTRLPLDQRTEIRPNDTIRIPGARFLVWDDRPLPTEAAPILTDTDELPPILRIDIPDVPPPAYLSTWDHSLVLTVLPPGSKNHSQFEVQAYYPMGRILLELVNLLGLPKREYSFMVENELINDNETPLSIGVKRGDVLVMVPKESTVSAGRSVRNR
jgi:hypothetical protein